MEPFFSSRYGFCGKPCRNVKEQFLRLKEITRTLREPGGCEWDRAQDAESLRIFLLEEAYEVIEAIHRGDTAGIREELDLCDVPKPLQGAPIALLTAAILALGFFGFTGVGASLKTILTPAPAAVAAAPDAAPANTPEAAR